jgi:hypothetical protein
MLEASQHRKARLTAAMMRQQARMQAHLDQRLHGAHSAVDDSASMVKSALQDIEMLLRQYASMLTGHLELPGPDVRQQLEYHQAEVVKTLASISLAPVAHDLDDCFAEVAGPADLAPQLQALRKENISLAR